jgi:hypothetical protein
VGKGARRESDNSEPDAVVVVLRRATIRMAGRRDRGPVMIRQAIAGLALMVSANGQAAAGEREFAAGLLGRLQSAMPDIELRISADDPLVIEMKGRHGWGDGELNLRPVHTLCSRITAEECGAFLDDYVAAASGERPEPVAENLRIVVRQADYLARLREKLPRDERPVSRQIGEDLFALLAFVDANGIAIATPGQIRALGPDEAVTWQRAGEQTRAMLPRLPEPIDIVRDYVAIEDGDLLSSVLADTDAWRTIADEVGPELAVAATTDQFVFVGALPVDARGMREFKRAVRDDCRKVQQCISPNVYRFRDGRWVIAE